VIEQFLYKFSNKKIVDTKNRLVFNFPICITPQIECYSANGITPIKEIPAEIRVLYDALLVRKKIPKKSRFYYTTFHGAPIMGSTLLFDRQKSEKIENRHIVKSRGYKKENFDLRLFMNVLRFKTPDLL